jgi:hypothetical protein
MRGVTVAAAAAVLALPAAAAHGAPASGGSVAAEPQPLIDSTDRSPRPPRAGRLYTVTMHMSAGGAPVAEATVSGKATVRDRRLPLVRKSFENSTARCVWRIPRSARNRYITVTMTIRTTGGGIAGSFNAIVR